MSVEKGFFETIDDVLAEKTNVRLQQPEVNCVSFRHSSCHFLIRLNVLWHHCILPSVA